MSGEFLKEMDDWHELKPEGRTIIFEGLLCDYWPEIRAVVESAEAHAGTHALDGSDCDELADALDAIDAKAKEKRLKPGACMYCGRSHVVDMDDLGCGPHQAVFRCEDCLAEWVEYRFPEAPTRQKLIKAGIP